MRKYQSSHLLALALGSIFIVACGGPRKYLAVEGKGKIALASFYLKKSIVEKDTEKDSGPGLLQKEETYYQHHQEAVDAMWAQLTDSIGGAFGNAEFLPFGEVFSKKSYTELTTYPPIKLFGLAMTPGADNIYPKGSRYVSGTNKQVVAALFDSLKVDYLLIFDNQAAARFTGTTGKIVSIGFRKGVLTLTTTISLFHKSDGMIWSLYNVSDSDTEGNLIDHELSPDLLPKMLVEAQAKLWKSVREEMELGRKDQAVTVQK